MEMPTHIIAVGGIVEDTFGNILLVKTCDGGWVFPGGQVEVGENLIDALQREILEESGIIVEVLQLIGVYSNTAIHKFYDGITDVPTKLILDFICKPTGGELAASEETTESKWVEKAKVLDYIASPAIRERYDAYLQFSGDVHYMEYVTKPAFDLRLKMTI